MTEPNVNIPAEMYREALQQHQLMQTGDGWACSCGKWSGEAPAFGEHQAEALARLGKPDENGVEMLRHFYLMRDEDVSGSSGMGKVAEAFVFENGKTVLVWLVAPMSVQVHDSPEALKSIHGHGGRTRLVPAIDEQPMTMAERKDMAKRPR